MPEIGAVLEVLCVHGEGDRGTVNTLAKNARVTGLQAARGISAAQAVAEAGEPDEPPDIIVLLRDPAGKIRIEWPVATGQEAEAWKQLVGWDPALRFWKSGARLTVTIAAAPPA
jgi:hypothetical protein